MVTFLHLKQKVPKKFHHFRAFLHVLSPCPFPSKSLSKFNIVSMVVDCFTDRLGLEPILSVSVNLTVAVMEMGMEMVCVNGHLCSNVQVWYRINRLATSHQQNHTPFSSNINYVSHHSPVYNKTR